MERHVDTGEEGFVECCDTISGEEEDTTIVLDVTKTKNIGERESENIGRQTVYNLQDGHHSVPF